MELVMVLIFYVLGDLGVDCAADVSAGDWHLKVGCSLHFQQLWIFVTVSQLQKMLLWWLVKATLTCECKKKNGFAGNIITTSGIISFKIFINVHIYAHMYIISILMKHIIMFPCGFLNHPRCSLSLFLHLPQACLSSTSSDNTPLIVPTSYQWCQMESF